MEQKKSDDQSPAEKTYEESIKELQKGFKGMPDLDTLYGPAYRFAYED